MKTPLKVIKFLFVSFLWTIILFGIVGTILKFAWNFNLFDARDWRIVSRFWNDGGIINSLPDVLFFIIIVAVIPLWILGIRKGMKINFIKLFTSPIVYLLNRGLDEAPKNVTIKNIDVNVQKLSKEEFIDSMVKKRMKEIDGDIELEQLPKTFEDIRKHLAEKK